MSRVGSVRTTLAAVGGSTNAVIHLLAIAGRLGVDLSLDDFDRIGSHVPVLVDLQPVGRFDFHRAGWLRAALNEVCDLLDPHAMTVTGEPLLAHLDEAAIWDREVIRTRQAPLLKDDGIAVLRGDLAPQGAVIKPAAAPHLMRHRGRGLAYDSVEDLDARVDEPDLDVDAASVLVLRGCGPRGNPGMPEVANMPVPKTVLEQGVRDMDRICDGRMRSCTACGTVVLHVAPEAAVGGPLARLRTDDIVNLDVESRHLEVEIPNEALARRTPNERTLSGFAAPQRGWERLYVDHVMQTDTGADLDFLVGSSGAEVTRESH
jgi:dihydroxyacid dehydratase/phosphogluconate dehydratase